MSRIVSITSEEEYQQALKRLDEVWDYKMHTPEEDEFLDLVDAILAYEDIHYPIPRPNLIYRAIAAIRRLCEALWGTAGKYPIL